MTPSLDELLETVKIYNPVPEEAEANYREALLREYAAYCEQEKPPMSQTATYHTTVRWTGEHWGHLAMGNGPEMKFSAPPDAQAIPAYSRPRMPSWPPPTPAS